MSLMPRPPEEIEAEADKEMAKIKSLCEKHQLTLDRETNDIVRHVMRGAVVEGVSKILSRDWLISTQLYLIEKTKRDSTRQRALEYIGELLGYNQNAGKSKEGQVMDIVLGAYSNRNADTV